MSRLGSMSVKRMCNECYVTDGTVANVPVVQGGAFFSFIQLGTTAQLADGRYQTPFVMRWNFTQLQNAAELQAVFDYYKIEKVNVFVTYNHNTSTLDGVRSLPSIYWVHDFDDNGPEGATALRERMGLKKKDFTSDRRCVKMSCRPRVPVGIEGIDGAGTGLTITAAGVRRPGYLDIQDDRIQHHGIKGYISGVRWIAAAAISDIQTSFKIDVQFVMKLRGVR